MNLFSIGGSIIGGVLGLTSGETNVANQISETVSKTTNNFFSKYATTTINESAVRGSGYQTMNIKLQNTIDCPISVTQNMRISIANTANNMNLNKAEISTSLLSELKRDIKQTVDQNASGFFTPKNVSNITTNIYNYLDNNVSTIIENTIKNIVKTDATGRQILEVDMSGSNCKGKVSQFQQDMLLIAIADQVTKSINDGIVKNEQINRDIVQVDQSTTQTSTMIGIGSSASAGCCCLLLIILALYLIYQYMQKRGR